METRSKVSNLSKGLIKRRKISDEKYRIFLEDMNKKSKEENPNADRYDLLVIVNTSKDGRENEIARKLKEAKASGMSGEEAIAEVFGPEYHGRVPGMGFGVTPTSYRYIRPLMENQRKRDAELLQKSEDRTRAIIEEMLAKRQEVRENDLPQTPVSFPSVQLQKQTIESSSKVCKMNSERTLSRGSASKATFLHLKDKARSGESPRASSSMINLKTPGESTNGDKRRACLLFSFHEENIVAEGRVMEVGPDERIHNEPMKHGCLKVSIDKIVNEDAYLIYPTEVFKKLKDAHRSFVQWPSEYVKIL